MFTRYYGAKLMLGISNLELILCMTVCFSKLRAFSQSRICDRCLAAFGLNVPAAMNYKNVGDTAAWPHTFLSHKAYLASPDYVSEWRIIPGWQLQDASFDWMHNMYLGVSRDFVASAIRCLVERGAYRDADIDPRDQDGVLAFIHEEIIEDCRSHGFLWHGCRGLAEPCYNVYGVLD